MTKFVILKHATSLSFLNKEAAVLRQLASRLLIKFFKAGKQKLMSKYKINYANVCLLSGIFNEFENTPRKASANEY